jgi:hypothetical protein
MTNHQSYNYRNKKDEERKDSRKVQFDSSLCFVERKPIDCYADSGTTHHMTDQRSFFSSFKEIDRETWKVKGIDGDQLNALGIGNIPVHSYIYGERKKWRIS